MAIFDDKVIHLRVSFGRSGSAYYGDAVAAARALPGYSERPHGKSVVHKVSLDLKVGDVALWDQVGELLRIAGHWQSTEVQIEGSPVPTFSGLQQMIGEVRRCYAEREHSVLGDAYCSGKSAPDGEPQVFGCRLLRGVSRSRDNYHRELRWWQFGTITGDGSSFAVDKDAVVEMCRARTGDHLCTLCPAFDWQRVESEIRDLPDRIEITDTSPFELRYSEIDPSRPLGIVPRRQLAYSAAKLSLSLLGEDDDQDAAPETRCVPAARYSDIGGQDAALGEIRNIVELPLRHAEYFEAVGIEPHRGIILYGPPGNGKTLIARAVAGESDAHIEIVSGPELLSKWVGQSEANLRHVFERARKLAPAIILIDELDAIAPSRDAVDHQHEISLISQLLVLLDGMEERGRVAVVGTTNRLEAVDQAVLRPGRFDYHIPVVQPDEEGRVKVLQTHLRRLKTSGDADLRSIAKRTAGLSGADLAAVCREAGLLAIQEALATGVAAESVAITQAELDKAVNAIRRKRRGGGDELETVP